MNLIVQVTFIEALDQLMRGFDPGIGKLAQRVLINPHKIDYHTGVFASRVLTSPVAYCMRTNKQERHIIYHVGVIT